MKLFLEIITTGSCEDPGAFVLLCNPWCPLLPPTGITRDYRAALHIWGRGDGQAISPEVMF